MVVLTEILYVGVFDITDITNPRYNKPISPVAWHFFKSRFHCTSCTRSLEGGGLRRVTALQYSVLTGRPLFFCYVSFFLLDLSPTPPPCVLAGVSHARGYYFAKLAISTNSRQNRESLDRLENEKCWLHSQQKTKNNPSQFLLPPGYRERNWLLFYLEPVSETFAQGLSRFSAFRGTTEQWQRFLSACPVSP